MFMTFGYYSQYTEKFRLRCQLNFGIQPGYKEKQLKLGYLFQYVSVILIIRIWKWNQIFNQYLVLFVQMSLSLRLGM